MKKVSFIDNCWNAEFLFVWGVDDNEFTKLMRRRFNVDVSGELTGDGYFVRLENTNGCDIGIIAMTAPVFEGTPYQYSVLAHECMHAAFRFMKSRGVRYSKNSEECFTYFTDNLIENLATKALAYERRCATK